MQSALSAAVRLKSENIVYTSFFGNVDKLFIFFCDNNGPR